jgi:outer membrane receptor protein involved in Fe transport
MTRFALRATTCAALTLLAGAAAAQAGDPTLKAIDIKGQALLQSESTPASRSSFDAAEIRELGVSQPEQVLSRVPGLRVMTYGLGGVVNVISLRGFGGGAHGGDLGFVLDGIPLNEAISHSDGYADLNVVIPLELERIDVVKGPSSVLVGNYNRAGSVFLQTRRGGNYQLADFSVGSFRTADTQLAGGWDLNRGSLNLAAQLFTTHEFRPQSGYDRGTLSGRWGTAIDRGELSVSARVHRGEWDSASYLTQAQFFGGNPYGRDPRAQNDGGEKTFHTLRVDGSRQLSDSVKLLAFAYGTRQTYTRFFSRPVSTTAWRQRDETYGRDVAGAGASLNGLGRVGGMPLKWLAGLETTRETTHYDYFDGTTQRARLGAPAARQDRDYRFNSTGAFAEAELTYAPWLRPTFGVRHDRYGGSCRSNGVEVVGGGDPPCNLPLRDANHTSPKLGVRSTVAPGVDLRASRNEGFQLANVRGLFSPGNNAQPTEYVQHEVGVTLGPWRGAKFDAAVFRLDSDNEIREIPAGSGVFVNSGQTRRKGFDLSLLWAFARDWDVSLGYGQAEGTIRANPNPALIGRKLNGVPRDTATAAIQYAPAQGWGGYATVNHVGRYFYDAAGLNTLSYPGFRTLDAGITWRGQWGANAVKARLAVTNLADKAYASNAFQIGGVALVAPGAPRAVQAGVQIDFQ